MIHVFSSSLSSIFMVLAVVAAAEEPTQPHPLVLDDPLESFVPEQPRSNAQQDRLHAGALYGTARSLFLRGDLDSSLRYLQRAWRWDPAADAVLAEIVPLAFSLNRPDQAVRYALLAARMRDTDALLLRRLALYVTESGDWSLAVKLYRKWLSHPDIQFQESQFDKLLVQLEIGRLEYLDANPSAASRDLEKFQTVMLKLSEDSPLAERLKRALGDDLNSTWELCGLAHLDAERFDLATEALAQIELPLDKSGRMGYLQARAAIGRGDPLTAWQLLRAYFHGGFTDYDDEPYALLATILSRLNQQNSVLEELQELHRQNPANAPARLALAEELERRGETDQAVTHYRGIIDADEWPAATLLRAVRQLVVVYAKASQADDLLLLLDRVVEQVEDVAGLQDILSAIPQSKQLTKSLLDASVRQDLDKTTERRALVLAALLMTANEYDAAGRFYGWAMELAPEKKSEVVLSWGLGLLLAEQYRDAADVFQRGIATRPSTNDDPTFEFYLSMALEMSNQTEAAIKAANRAIAMRPESSEIAARLPWILFHADREAEARQEYKALVNRFESSRDEEIREALREARLVLSTLAVLAGDHAEGEEWLEQILDEFPEDVGAKNDLAYLWAEKSQHLQRARRFAEQAVAEAPDNPAYRDSLGWVLFRLGEHQLAAQELERAVELSRGANGDDAEGTADGVILDHLGDALYALGSVSEAVKSWQEAILNMGEATPEKVEATRQKIATNSEEGSAASLPLRE